VLRFFPVATQIEAYRGPRDQHVKYCGGRAPGEEKALFLNDNGVDIFVFIGGGIGHGEPDWLNQGFGRVVVLPSC
jgi:hypothetical protein